MNSLPESFKMLIKNKLHINFYKKACKISKNSIIYIHCADFVRSATII